MKVYELAERLREFDPNAELKVVAFVGDDYTETGTLDIMDVDEFEGDVVVEVG